VQAADSVTRVEDVENTASWVRRFGALAIDWAASSLVTLAVLGPDGYAHDRYAGWVTLGVFWLEASVGTALAGASFGQLVTRIRVLRLDGRPLPLIPAVVRALLVCLVIPPLIFRPDGRGLHDLAVGSAVFAAKR
jgi:uncharacterized RDD family membrane protein YckC